MDKEFMDALELIKEKTENCLECPIYNYECGALCDNVGEIMDAIGNDLFE